MLAIWGIFRYSLRVPEGDMSTRINDIFPNTATQPELKDSTTPSHSYRHSDRWSRLTQAFAAFSVPPLSLMVLIKFNPKGFTELATTYNAPDNLSHAAVHALVAISALFIGNRFFEKLQNNNIVHLGCTDIFYFSCIAFVIFFTISEKNSDFSNLKAIILSFVVGNLLQLAFGSTITLKSLGLSKYFKKL